MACASPSVLQHLQPHSSCGCPRGKWRIATAPLRLTAHVAGTLFGRAVQPPHSVRGRSRGQQQRPTGEAKQLWSQLMSEPADGSQSPKATTARPLHAAGGRQPQDVSYPGRSRRSGRYRRGRCTACSGSRSSRRVRHCASVQHKQPRQHSLATHGGGRSSTRSTRTLEPTGLPHGLPGRHPLPPLSPARTRSRPARLARR
jgi:hypothetical protein